MIQISDAAQTYLQELLTKQEQSGTGIRVFVAQPGTPQAETCIAYCRPGEEQLGDVPVEYEGFRAWFEERSQPYLVDAVVEAPFGAHPGEMTNCYERDEDHIRKYIKATKDPSELQKYLETWIYNIKDHHEYLNMVGSDTLDNLRIGGQDE